MIVRVSKHTFATPKEYQKSSYVDHVGIGGRKKQLPGEISEHSGNASGEVSRGRSSYGNEPQQICGGLTGVAKV